MIIFQPSLHIGNTNETFEFFLHYRNDGEQLGLSTFHKNDLTVTYGMDFFYQCFENFLSYSKNNDYYEAEENFWITHVEALPKFFWLSFNYLDNNYKFDNYLGVHWHTREKKWLVHPGIMRFNIIKLFQKQEYLQCITFNTGGFEHNFDLAFENYNDFEKCFSNKVLDLNLVPDQGSLIPHLSVEKASINNSIPDYFYYLKDFFQKTHIKTNSRNKLIKMINKNNKKNKTKTEEIIFKNEDKPDDIFKSLIYLTKRRNFEPENYIINYD